MTEETLERKALKACFHILHRISTDSATNYHFGFGTETFQLLCEVEAAYNGQDLELVKRRRMNCSDPQPRICAAPRCPECGYREGDEEEGGRDA